MLDHEDVATAAMQTAFRLKDAAVKPEVTEPMAAALFLQALGWETFAEEVRRTV